MGMLEGWIDGCGVGALIANVGMSVGARLGAAVGEALGGRVGEFAV